MIVATSGGFDPLHPGHLSLFEAVRREYKPTTFAVIVDSDEWLAKKHPPLLSQPDRCRLLRSVIGVDLVLASSSPDDASDCVTALRPDVYCVGSDHEGPVPEAAACAQVGCALKRVQADVRMSSTNLLRQVSAKLNPPVVVNALIVKEGCVLVCERGHADRKGSWELPGGFLEPGETAEQALARELREELNLSVKQVQYFKSYLGAYSDGRQLLSLVYVCEPDGTPQTSQESTLHAWAKVAPTDMFAECDRQALEDYFR